MLEGKVCFVLDSIFRFWLAWEVPAEGPAEGAVGESFFEVWGCPGSGRLVPWTKGIRTSRLASIFTLTCSCLIVSRLTGGVVRDPRLQGDETAGTLSGELG